MNWLLLLMALLAGMALPLQASLNSQMSKYLGHPIFASLVSFIVGSVGLFIYAVVVRLPTRGLFKLGEAPPWDWLAGALGAFYVAATVILLPRLGATLTFGLVIAGQMLISISLDHYGLMGLAVKEINPGRIVGISLLIIGVVLIRKY